jgi:hypothetical protein
VGRRFHGSLLVLEFVLALFIGGALAYFDFVKARRFASILTWE